MRHATLVVVALLFSAAVSRGEEPMPPTFLSTLYTVSTTSTATHVPTVLGQAVPGRQIDVAITADCQVEFRVSLDRVKRGMLNDKTKTTVLTIPAVEVIGRLPKDSTYEISVISGALRATSTETDAVADCRNQILERISDEAKTSVLRDPEKVATARKTLRAALTKHFAADYPAGTTVIVEFE